jgi:hypothetical protein
MAAWPWSEAVPEVYAGGRLTAIFCAPVLKIPAMRLNRAISETAPDNPTGFV